MIGMEPAFCFMFQLLSLFWTLPGFHLTELETMYVSIGSNVIIKCPSGKANFWQDFESKEILAICENGQNTINPSLNESNRISVTGDCQLHIHNFSTEDLHTFLCTANSNEEGYYKILLKLRKITIEGTDGSGIIQGIEGKFVTLTCNVIGILPADILYWIHNNKFLTAGNTSSLSYTFLGNRSYNMNEFICMTNNSKDIRPLKARVQLNLLLKPAVSISVFINSNVRKKGKSITVKRDQHMVLLCTESTNISGDVEMFTWLCSGYVLQNNTNMVVFNKTNPAMSGLYTCVAMNEAGKDSDAVFITVTYSHLLVINNYSWEIGVISSVAVVVFLVCLYGTKYLVKRVCCNLQLNRNTRSNRNEITPVSEGDHYEEIDSMYYNPINVNGRSDHSHNNTPLETLSNDGIHEVTTSIDNMDNVGEENNSSIISFNGTEANLSLCSADIVSEGSSSDHSFLVPCRKYFNIEIDVTDEPLEQSRIQENIDDSSSTLNSVNSQTQILCDHQYETLATTNIEEHTYASPIETN